MQNSSFLNDLEKTAQEFFAEYEEDDTTIKSLVKSACNKLERELEKNPELAIDNVYLLAFFENIWLSYHKSYTKFILELQQGRCEASAYNRVFAQAQEYFVKRGLSKENAEDLASQFFIDLQKYCNKFNLKSSHEKAIDPGKPYIQTMWKNLCNKHLNKAKSKEKLEPLQEVPDNKSKIDWQSEAQRLDKAINSLKAKEQLVIQYSLYREQMPQRAIADVESIPDRTRRDIKKRAVEKLQEFIRNME